MNTAERMKAWQCIGCGRLESDAACLGICQDRSVVVVSAADYDEARHEIDELRLFIRQLALVSPRGDNWQQNYLALRERAHRLLGEPRSPTDGQPAASEAFCASHAPQRP